MSINKIYNIQEWQQVTTVATPSASASIIYPKTDGNWYFMNSDGVEKISSLSYNIGNGLTSSTASGLYNYNLSVSIDGFSLTFSNGKINVGYLTSSVFSQLGPATSSYILSVNSSGTPIWIPYSSQGINGTAGYIPKFNDVNSITNSNIYDGGTYVSFFTSSNSTAPTPNIFINGNVDALSYYINKNVTNISISSTISGVQSILRITTPNLLITEGTNNLISASSSGNGYSVNLLNVLRVSGTTSTNPTSSVIMSDINLVGIGTASPTHLFTIFATQSAFRLIDGSQGNNKYLVSDANGVASWTNLVISGSVSLSLAGSSGLTVSNYQYSILLSPNSGLTLSTTGLSINPNSIGYGLSFSGGTLSVSGNFGINVGNGLTSSGSTYSVNLGINSGLTFSNSNVIIQIGTGLTLSNGALASTGLVFNGVTNSLPYFNNSSTLTSSVISQVSNNILIGTTSNVGAKLYVSGSVSITSDAIINGASIGRGSNLGNLLFGNNIFGNAVTSGGYNVAIGDNTFVNNTSGTNSIAIGLNALNQLNSGNGNVVIGNYAVTTGNPNNTVAIGFRVSQAVGDESVVIGAHAGYAGSKNIAIGYQSGNAIVTTNTQNIFIGYQAGQNFTGSYSVFIGGYNPSANSTSNNIFIADGQGNLRIYSPSTGNVLIGTTSETGSRLVINGSASFWGNLRIVDNTQASGKLLLSDTNGNTTWFMPVGLGMTISGYTFSVNLQANSGLTVSMSGLAINPSIAGYGLTYSGGSMSFTTNINALQGYIPYFNTITSLTSSVIYQTASNILIGTVSNNGAKLLIAGSVSIISATGNAFQLRDTTQAAGYLLQSDANGYGSWKSYKYSATQSFTANLSSVVNHNLNSMFYIIQLFDYTTGEEILGGYTNRGLTQATITLTTDVPNCGVVIMG
jgi:hypothetical protein